MRLLKRSALAGVVCLFAFAGAVSAVPTAQLVVNGGAPINITMTPDGKTFIADELITGSGWSVDVDLFFDPDPFIQYGLAVTNNTGGPLSFGFLFSQSIALTPTPGTVNTSISGSTTNGGGGPGVVTITPLAPPGGTPVDLDAVTEIQVFNLSNANDGGATLTNATIDLGPAFASNGSVTSDNYPCSVPGPPCPLNSPIIPGPLGTGSYDFMRVDLNFSQSGGGDIFTFNGSARVLPEPATAALFALGLLALGYAGRRRS